MPKFRVKMVKQTEVMIDVEAPGPVDAWQEADKIMAAAIEKGESLHGETYIEITDDDGDPIEHEFKNYRETPLKAINVSVDKI